MKYAPPPKKKYKNHLIQITRKLIRVANLQTTHEMV